MYGIVETIYGIVGSVWNSSVQFLFLPRHAIQSLGKEAAKSMVGNV